MTSTDRSRTTRRVIAWFRVVAVAEAVSYLSVLTAAVLKRTADMEGLVPVIGPIHGIIFLVYLGLTLAVADELAWPGKRTLLVIVAAVIPLGGIYVERKVLPAHPASPTPSSVSA